MFKKKSGKLFRNRWSYVRSCRLYCDFFEGIRRKRYFPPPPSSCPSRPFYSLFLLFPLLWLSSLLALSVFPLFIIFCSLSQPGRSRLGRWTSWNDLAIASRCFLFFFFLFTSTFLSLLFFLNPCNAGHSSWEAPTKNCAFCDIRSCTSVSRHEKFASTAYSGSRKYSNTYRYRYIICNIPKKNLSKVLIISSVVRFNYYDCIGKVWNKENVYRNYFDI